VLRLTRVLFQKDDTSMRMATNYLFPELMERPVKRARCTCDLSGPGSERMFKYQPVNVDDRNRFLAIALDPRCTCDHGGIGCEHVTNKQLHRLLEPCGSVGFSTSLLHPYPTHATIVHEWTQSGVDAMSVDVVHREQ